MLKKRFQVNLSPLCNTQHHHNAYIHTDKFPKKTIKQDRDSSRLGHPCVKFANPLSTQGRKGLDT